MDINERLREKLIDKDVTLDKTKLDSIRKEHDGVYMFFSFDLENSTKFKSLFPTQWSTLSLIFYDRIESIFKHNIEKEREKYIKDVLVEESKLDVWKLVGDEILFYKMIDDPKELFFNIKAVYYTMEDFYKELRDSEKFLKGDKNIIKPNIDIKATTWIAKCSAIPNEEDNYIYIKGLKSEFNQAGALGQTLNVMDFLGPDIDEGFRIGKQCSSKKITISAKLAYTIYYLSREKDVFLDLDKKSINELFKIVHYTKLRGIWDGRLYPIIFYTHKWNEENELFSYDDYYVNDIVKNFNKVKDKEESKISYLKKVLDDLDLREGIEKLAGEVLKQNLKDKNSKSMYKPDERVPYVNSELHCVAMCVNNEDKILIFKRTEKRRMPGLWECGCAKMNSNENWDTCLITEYKDNLGIKIIVEHNPIPLATYSFKKDKIIVPGVIFKASIDNRVECKPNLGRYYSEFKFMTKDEIEQMGEEEFVDGLKNNILKLFSNNF